MVEIYVDHQKIIKRKTGTEKLKVMNKYVQLKRFNHDHQHQVYMNDFMYVDTDTIPAEDNFLDKNVFVVTYKKMSTPGTVPKHWLGFSYIRSEEYVFS